MGMKWRRLKIMGNAKFEKILDKHEDPRETLDYSYARQYALYQQIKQGHNRVKVACNRIRIQISQEEKKVGDFLAAAETAMRMGNEPLAKEFLTKRVTGEGMLVDLKDRLRDLEAEEERVAVGVAAVEQRLNFARTEKEVLKSQYTAAESLAAVGEAFQGLDGEWGDIGQSWERAQDQLLTIQARAASVSELTGGDALGGMGSAMLQLKQAAAAHQVDDEMTSLRARVLPALEAAPAEEGTPE